MNTNEFNSTLDNSSSDFNNENYFTKYTAVFTSIILTIEIPLICVAIYAVFFLTKSGQGAPVFVINLLIADLIQIASTSLIFIFDEFHIYLTCAFFLAFLPGTYFMTCVAVERYLLIAHPVWYRSHHPVKCLVCICLIGWLSPFIIFLIGLFLNPYLLSVFPFVYYLVIIFSFAGAYRALSHSQSITSLKRRLVLSSLFFVLLSYTFTVLPSCISLLLLLLRTSHNLLYYVLKCAFIFNMLNPITDCVLYVFMRNDAGNAFSVPHCCPRRGIQSNNPNRGTETKRVTDLHQTAACPFYLIHMLIDEIAEYTPTE